MALMIEGQTLDEAIAAYNDSFIQFQYDLPEFWKKREEIGLPLSDSSLPLTSRVANFLLVEVNSQAFPWGYLYGFFNIEDEESRAFELPDGLIQMAMTNMAVFLPALVLIIVALFLPIVYTATYLYRWKGSCGGTVSVHNLIYQKRSIKLLTVVAAIVNCLVIIFGVVQFMRSARPVVNTLPSVAFQLFKLGLHDFDKFFKYCIEEIQHFLSEGLFTLLRGGVVTITEDFGGIIFNITGRLSLNELDTLVETLRNASNDVEYLKEGLRNATDIVNTANSALTNLTTDYVAMKESLQDINEMCSKLGYLASVACSGVPAASDLPPPPTPIDIGFDGEMLLSTVDTLDINEMLARYDSFNLSLITDLAGDSIPLDAIYQNIRDRTEEVQKSIDWESLNPLTPEFVDSALKSAESFVNNPMFGYMDKIIKGMAIVPIIYAVCVLIGVVLGMFGTSRESFPCPERSSSSEIGAHFLSKAQLAPLMFNCFYAVLCGILLSVMSIFSILTHSFYTHDIIYRVVDRIPDSFIQRSLTINIGSNITTIISGERVLRTCGNNGGTLKAIGIDIGDFSNITSILEEIEWPDIDAFKVNIEQQLDDIRESAIPKHSEVAVVQNYLNALTLPTIDFTELANEVEENRLITIGGTQKTMLEFANELETKATAIRAHGNHIADELDTMVNIIRNIDAYVNVISNCLTDLGELYADMGPRITVLQTKVSSLFTDMVNLGDKLTTEARNFLNEAVINVKSLLNSVKLRLRQAVFEMINFLLNNMFRCRIVYEFYTILSQFFYNYLTSYLNGVWLSLLAICSWMMCSAICWSATKFFMRVYDWTQRKRTATLKHQSMAPTTTVASAI